MKTAEEKIDRLVEKNSLQAIAHDIVGFYSTLVEGGLTAPRAFDLTKSTLDYVMAHVYGSQEETE